MLRNIVNSIIEICEAPHQFSTREEAAMSETGIEAEIQAKGKTAPRITPADIEQNIAGETYFTAADGVLGAYKNHDDVYQGTRPHAPEYGLLTFCVLVLKNGFTVTGESACASPENFDAELGRKIARKNAVDKVWPLMGYELRTELARVPGPHEPPRPLGSNPVA
jgi:hypothetical protein